MAHEQCIGRSECVPARSGTFDDKTAQILRGRRVSRLQFLLFPPAHPCLPTFVCLPTSVLPSNLRSYLPTVVPAFRPSFLPSGLSTFPFAFLPSYLRSCLQAFVPAFPPSDLSFLPSCLPAFRPVSVVS